MMIEKTRRDPWLDRQQKDEEDEEWAKMRPVCEVCEEHITEEGAYCIDDCWYHRECLNKYWRWF